jgi:hypothetical protein
LHKPTLKKGVQNVDKLERKPKGNGPSSDVGNIGQKIQNENKQNKALTNKHGFRVTKTNKTKP